MKKYFIHIAVFLLILTPASNAAYIDTDAEVAVVIDGHTGKVLFSKNKDKKTYPASMTKIMTTLIIFEKLANETLSLDDKFLVSENPFFTDKLWLGRKIAVEICWPFVLSSKFNTDLFPGRLVCRPAS